MSSRGRFGDFALLASSKYAIPVFTSGSVGPASAGLKTIVAFRDLRAIVFCAVFFLIAYEDLELGLVGLHELEPQVSDGADLTDAD